MMDVTAAEQSESTERPFAAPSSTGGVLKCDCLWATNLDGQIAGTIGLEHKSPSVAKLRCFRLDPELRHTNIPEKLIRRIREHCWAKGYVKLVAEAGHVPNWFLPLLCQHDFQMRPKAVAREQDACEFYLDLYYRLPDELPNTTDPHVRKEDVDSPPACTLV